jgi:hypothetical protein
MTRAPMTLYGRLRLLRLAKLAEQGNAHAAAWLRDVAQRELANGLELPPELRAWLDCPPARRRRGKPTATATAATAHVAIEHGRTVEMAAWAAWWNVRAGMATSRDGAAGPAFQTVADWLSSVHGVHVGASAVRTWYYANKDALTRQHAAVEAIAAAL